MFTDVFIYVVCNCKTATTTTTTTTTPTIYTNYKYCVIISCLAAYEL